MSEAQERLRAKRSREARAERASLDAAHEREFAEQLRQAEEIAAEMNPDAPRPDWSDPTVLDPSTRPQDTRQLRVTRGSAVTTKSIRWLLPDWIPRGSLTLLAGREGLGKSTIACAWAAYLTKQGKTVIYVHTEDSREHTVVPRLIAAGANLDLILFVDVATEATDTGTVVLPLDNQRLEDLVIAEKVEFIVLDAATSAMASQLSGKDDRQVRQFLEPLAQLAARQDIVVLGLVHFGKRDGADTGKLILGSIAWSQVARSVLSVAHDEEEDRLILTNTKGNLATRIRSEACRVVSRQVQLDDGPAEIGAIEWLGEVDADARDHLAGEDQREQAGTVSEIVMWLEDYLTEYAPCPSADVKKAALKIQFSDRSLKRAAKKLGVVSESKGFPRITWWSLPGQSDSVVEGEVIDSGASETGTHAGKVGPTGPTGADLHKQDGPTVLKSQSGQPTMHGPTSGPTVLHAVPDDTARPTCRQWLDARITALIDSGATTASSAEVYAEGQAAGYRIDNLRQAASKSHLIAIARKLPAGGAIWNIGQGAQSTAVPCSQWIVSWLQDREWVSAGEVIAAGEAAGYGRTAIKSASLAAHVLKRGQSTLTEWRLDPEYVRRSA
ncbi:AAA family ATPase [Tsukamurella tyrosinosolvens]|uniref:AAA family ATPase n=1 Tax=Tsukamurella tyrosinosolvens TaxID=57704 RepID=UPI00346376BF